ncbi:MAG: leucyl/phenylalanyl-tRNA--protein transferase [Desulfuromonadales bacterium]|jgi:leucyl/phenylalanyl-tRNA---protein transferase
MPVFRLTEDLVFPDPHLAGPDGLLAIGGDLSVGRLVLAYQNGIFPWYDARQPILWWSPDPRCVFFPAQVHVSRRLARQMRQKTYHLTFNQAFNRVIKACAEVRVHRGEGTWLIPEMQAAYQGLFEAGYAHSVEAWQDGTLAGGLYGVALGPFFFGESMFHERTNASKVILVALLRYLQRQGFVLFDCQVPNPHLFRMGACHIDRDSFLRHLSAGGLGPLGKAEKVVFPDRLSAAER